MSDVTLEGLDKDVSQLTNRVDYLDMIVIRGTDTVPSLRENIHTTMAFNASLKFWMTTIGVAFVGQFVAVLVLLFYTVIQILPYLKILADRSVDIQ